MNTNEIIEFYLDNDVLISPEFKDSLEEPLPLNAEYIVLNKDTVSALNNKIQIHPLEFEKSIVMKEKRKNTKLYDKFIEILEGKAEEQQQRQQQEIRPAIKDEIKKNISPIPSSINAAAATPILTETVNHTSISTNNQVAEGELKLQSLDVVESDDGRTENLEDADALQKPLVLEQAISLEARQKFLDDNKIKIVSNYTSKSKKWTVADFVSLYTARFKEIEKILRSRTELQNLTSIKRISEKKERENVALIGVVYEKSVTKAGNIMFTIEDQTGSVKVVVSKTKEEAFKLAEEIQLDETIGITGMFDQIVFASKILFPDIPLTKELKKSPEEGYMLVISDTQVGGKLFLEKEFEKLISWINGSMGNERQKEIASQIKYIFIAGDLVEGVGVYPNQEYDLSILDVKDQYIALGEMLRKIPSHIPIFVCPGNHDVGRLSEPQPPLGKEYANPVISLPNVISISNPSMVNVYAHPQQGFDGFDVMFYHGGSLIYYSENIVSIRKAGGQRRPDLIMKYWLQRRHLAPTHSSTLYIPDPKRDPLVIDKVPDILITGHIHRASVSNYKNVTCFNASCWVAKSPEQERRGLEPQPARAFIIDMRTREVKIMNFLSREDQEKEGETKEMN